MCMELGKCSCSEAHVLTALEMENNQSVKGLHPSCWQSPGAKMHWMSDDGLYWATANVLKLQLGCLVEEGRSTGGKLAPFWPVSLVGLVVGSMGGP